MQNGREESFNGRLRDECLNASWFLTLSEAKQKIETRREEYNRERPHSGLGYQTPEQFARGVCAFGVESFNSAGCSARQR
jgi:putative transposase